MKTIEVTDEMYKSLMELSEEMTTQDNRCTAMPHMFQVQETRKVPASEGCGEEVWYNPECEQELRTNEEIIEWLSENENDLASVIIEEGVSEAKFGAMENWDLDTLLEEKGFSKFYETDGNTYSNTFFTSKGCDEHIRINGHNLHNPVNYLTHAYRNAEMDLVSKFLCEISGGKMHR